MRKPKVTTKCVADMYSALNERIVEFSFPGADRGDGTGSPGGLIRFVQLEEACIVEVYRVDDEVVIRAPSRNSAPLETP